MNQPFHNLLLYKEEEDVPLGANLVASEGVNNMEKAGAMWSIGERRTKTNTKSVRKVEKSNQ